MVALLAAAFGPIFAKELVEMARRWRYYLGRIIYGSALLIALLIVALDRPRIFWTSNLSIRDSAALANALFTVVSILQYAAVYLFVPVFLCGVVAGEREERTLELLFTTHLTNRQIILSKLMSRLFVVALLILSALPVFGLITLFGGVDPQVVFMNTAATLLALLFVGSLSIYVSVTTKSPIGALVRTYWWLLNWLLGVPALTAATGSLALPRTVAGTFGDYLIVSLFFWHPVAIFMLGMNPFMLALAAGLLGTTWFYPLTFIVPTAVSVLLLWRACRRLRFEPPSLRQRYAWLGAPWRWLFGKKKPMDQKRPPRRRWRPRREVENPFWQRARRVHIYDREGYLGGIQLAGWGFALLFLILLLAVQPRALSDEEASFVFLIPTLLGLTVLTVLVASSSIVGDRRRGFFELALVTPVTARQVVDGTLLAVWQHLRPVCLLALVLASIFALTGASHWIGLLVSFISAGLFCILLAYVGIGCSLAARTYVGALTPTFLYVLVLNFGLFGMVGLFRQASGPALWVIALGLMIVAMLAVRRWTNPVVVGMLFLASYLSILSVATFWAWDPGGRRMEVPVAMMLPGYLALRPLEHAPERWFDRRLPWLAVYLFYWSGLVINILFARWWLIRHFDRLVGRGGRRRAPGRTAVKRVEQELAAVAE